MRILIVEDCADIGRAMEQLIRLAGHQAHFTADGHEAIRTAIQETPDVALVDINMPGMDGYDTARELREKCGEQFPVFAITASPIDVARATATGFEGFFAKPFDRDKFLALLQEMSRRNDEFLPTDDDSCSARV